MAASATYSPSANGKVLMANGQPVFEHQIAWVDGGTAGTIPDAEIPENNVSGGLIYEIGFKFSAVTVPDTITIAITDQHGIEIFPGNTGDSATLTATGRLFLTRPIMYVGPLTVAHSGNTTVNAIGTTYILVG